MILPQQQSQAKVYTLDEYIEEEENVKFPEVPIDILDTKKAEMSNVDKEIESRLVKLKFFNQTWLKDVSETEAKKTDNEVSNANNVKEETDDQVVAVEVENDVKWGRLGDCDDYFWTTPDEREEK